MDSAAVAIAENERFQKFKLGKKPAHAHTRSHSRNDSISSLKSLTTGNDFSHFSLPLTNHNGATKPPRPLSLPPLVPPGSTNNQNSGVLPTASTAVSNPMPSSKRNSHHRRRSSVSTRHESAELMGMSVPNLPPAAQEDNINLGEKDFRRRALWALEGKPDVAFNKVEIPDFSTTDMENFMPSKSSLTPSNSSSYGNALNMNNKRDSFKLLAGSSSSKDQLQTLVEEEEEEEEEEDLHCLQTKVEESLPSPAPSIKENIPPFTSVATLGVTVAQQPVPKPRPTALNLRPLSLTPGNLMTALSNSPSPSLRPGLRPLSLTPSSGGSDDSSDSLKQLRLCSQFVTPPASKRPVLNLALGQITDSPADGEEGKVSDRRSSISYKCSSNGAILNGSGLATPEMTPTFGRRFSTFGSSLSMSSSAGVSEEDGIFNPPAQTQTRPLSTSEQHFLFKSHHALLARITDLEKALSGRMRDSAHSYSRGPSISSTVSGSSDSENLGTRGGPSDEMLRLIADLKAERDELKRDVDGWRQRVNNLESQTTVLAKRVESERREAWVARSKAGLLDVEKGVLTRKLEAVDELIRSHEKEKESWEQEKETYEKEVEGYKEWVGELENELMFVKKELDCEKVKALHDPLATPTPNKTFENAFVRPVVIISPPEATGKNHGLGFMSADSESSTDVELDSFDDPKTGFGLNAVGEEFDAGYEDEDNELAGYEDEDEADDMSHISSSSFDSVELSHPIRRRIVDLPSPTTPTFGIYDALPPAPIPYHMSPSHFYQSSLSMNWTFPKGPATTASIVEGNEEEGVDRFFDCLDDNDSENGEPVPTFSYEKSKGLFARGFVLGPGDDDAAFFLPSGVGVPILVPIPEEPVKQRTQLEVVTEEEEEEEEEEEQSDFEDDGAMFGDIGGIKITFTPPQEENEEEEKEQIQVFPPKRTSPPPILPALNFGDDTEDDPFGFGHPLIEERTLSSAKKSPLVLSPLPPVPVPVVKPAPPPVPVIVSSPPPVTVAVSATGSTSPSSSLPRSTSQPSCISMIPRVVSPPISSRVTSPVPAVSIKRPSSTRIPRSPTPSDKTSSIPQPLTRNAPTPPPKPKTTPTSTFIRQPSVRKSSLPRSIKAETANAGSSPNVPLDERTLNRSTSECRPFMSFINSFVHNQSAVGSKMNVDFVPDDQLHTRLQPFHNDSQSLTRTIPSVISPSSSTTRLSFQTLTNFVSWPSRNRPPTAARSPLPPTPVSPSRVALPKVSPGKRQFVSRETQLRRLRSRMQMEDMAVIKSCVHCKKCSGEVAFI